MNIMDFKVERDKCVGCARCVRVCPGGLISLDKERKAYADKADEFGWDGCWKCQHCMAVCPQGAISVLGRRPEDSLPPAPAGQAAPMLEAIIANRHSCRRYRDENVPEELIYRMIKQLANAPNGGNKQQVEFTLISDRAQTERFRRLVYGEMERLAAKGTYPTGFDKKSYEDMKRWEKTVRPDMLLCGAPHLLIPHSPTGRGEPVQDVNIAGAYFELLCAANGLGCIFMTFPLAVLDNMPKIKALLNIPEDRYTGSIIGFGYPEIPYSRGCRREVEPSRIHRITF